MIMRLITLALIAGAAYWYWTGPYQEKNNPSYDAVLLKNQQNMTQCQRAKAYQLGATGSGAGPELAETQCAEQFNLYYHDGAWHSHDATRPGQ